MRPFSNTLLFLVGAVSAYTACRNVPGSAGYPNAAAWSKLNATISGRLVAVVPSAKYGANLPGGACTDAQWTSGLFRATIPGAMNQVCTCIVYVFDITNRSYVLGEFGAGVCCITCFVDQRTGLRPEPAFTVPAQRDDMWARRRSALFHGS